MEHIWRSRRWLFFPRSNISRRNTSIVFPASSNSPFPVHGQIWRDDFDFGAEGLTRGTVCWVQRDWTEGQFDFGISRPAMEVVGSAVDGGGWWLGPWVFEFVRENGTRSQKSLPSSRPDLSRWRWISGVVDMWFVIVSAFLASSTFSY